MDTYRIRDGYGVDQTVQAVSVEMGERLVFRAADGSIAAAFNRWDNFSKVTPAEAPAPTPAPAPAPAAE